MPSSFAVTSPALRVGQFRLRFPTRNLDLDQDEEWGEVFLDGSWRRLRFHDYDEIYSIPGLYESLFYRHLKCCSPNRVIALLNEVIRDEPRTSAEDLRVLDLGAGNGMVGQELRSIGVPYLVGVDILPEALEATMRDRPWVYDDFMVADFTDLGNGNLEHLEGAGFNALTTVAALGFGDIPPDAFINACNLIDTPGWLAFNIKENFLDEEVDETGFAGLIRRLRRQGYIRIQAYRRYRHRLSIFGEPLFYVAMVAQKMKPIPKSWLDGGR
jgi:hypothetical protein